MLIKLFICIVAFIFMLLLVVDLFTFLIKIFRKSHLDVKQTKLLAYGAPTLTTSFGLKVRSKSEIIIAEKLHEKKIPFQYEQPLKCKNKTYYPDFTICIGTKIFYWEHFGMLHNKTYAKKTDFKMRWYKTNFPNRLIWTVEHSDFALEVHNITESLKDLA